MKRSLNRQQRVCIYIHTHMITAYAVCICYSEVVRHPVVLGFTFGSAGKESASDAGNLGFHLWVGKIPWRRERLPTPVLWPGEFHGLYSPWGHKESGMTEQLSLSLFHKESCLTLCDPRTVACQALLFMGFSRQESWSGLPRPPPGDLPHPGVEPESPALQVDSFLPEPTEKYMYYSKPVKMVSFICWN